ncbi:MAG TPA: MlaD family protein [Longimicrobiales bacterium]|nr:MlaD family protein [Longimicrobiales bacterium]
MPRTQKDHRALGGFIIIATLVTAALLIVNIRAIADLSKDRLEIVVVVPEAPGVRVGTRVWVDGVESGRVQAIQFVPGADSVQVALDVRLDGRTRAALRADSEARAFRERFVGQPVITLEGGSPDAPALRDGDTVYGAPYLDVTEITARAKALPGALESLLSRARTIGARVDARRPALDALGRQVDAASAAAGALTDQMEDGSLALLLAEDGLGPRLGTLRERIDSVSTALGAVLESESPGGAHELAASLNALQDRLGRLQEDVDSMRLEGDGFLTRMGRDSAISVAVRGVQAQMDTVRQEAFSIILRMLLPAIP